MEHTVQARRGTYGNKRPTLNFQRCRTNVRCNPVNEASERLAGSPGAIGAGVVDVIGAGVVDVTGAGVTGAGVLTPTRPVEM